MEILANFSGLDSLQTVEAGAYLLNNNALESFHGLEALRSINGLLQIRNNPALKDPFFHQQNLPRYGTSQAHLKILLPQPPEQREHRFQ